MDQIKHLNSQVDDLTAEIKSLNRQLRRKKDSSRTVYNSTRRSPQVAPAYANGPPLLPKAAAKQGVPIPWKSVPATSCSAMPAPYAASIDGNIQSAIRELRRKSLSIPVDGITPESLKGSFYQSRGSRQHNAVDMLEPRSTPIHAVENGSIGRLFFSAAGGNTIYQKDPKPVSKLEKSRKKNR